MSYTIYYFEEYYPRGGINDYVNQFNTKEEVFNYISGLHKDFLKRLTNGYATLQVVNNTNKTFISLVNDFEITNVLADSKYEKFEINSSFEFYLEECEAGFYNDDY